MNAILVIDDKPEFLATQTRRVFPHGDVVVHPADTCELGLKLAVENNPAAVLIEFSPSRADGLNTFHRVRALNPACPVIVVTENPRAEVVVEAIRSGAFDYIAKPVQLAHLQEVVLRALALSRQARLLCAPREPVGPTTAVELDLSILDDTLRAFVLGKIEDGTGDVLSTAMEAFECQLYRVVWEAVGQNQAKASRVMGISNRRIKNKLLHYCLLRQFAVP